MYQLTSFVARHLNLYDFYARELCPEGVFLTLLAESKVDKNCTPNPPATICPNASSSEKDTASKTKEAVHEEEELVCECVF